jgi:NAD(P) transhydrogenase subunit alpha
MKVFAPKETFPGETRAPLTPDAVRKLELLGAQVSVESGVGEACRIPDAQFAEAGTGVAENAETALKEADVVVRLRPPEPRQIEPLGEGAIHISFLDPFNNLPLLEKLAEKNVTAISMEMIPRTTLAQKMDALSSQANLAGYAAVIVAAERIDKALPMMMTPSGTISPARVFVIGVGVAGLQAIATAKRLGARVDAFDTRPAVEEQVKSLGAKFLKIDLGETGETDQGYAKELTPEQLAKQKEGMAKQCEISDIVITTAQVFGRKAPVIISTEMVKRMKPGTVVVDLAVESGGNVECSQLNEEVELDGVRVVGIGNLPGRVAIDASAMYASNLVNLLTHFWDKEEKKLNLNLDDEILKGCVLTHGGSIVNERIRQHHKIS